MLDARTAPQGRAEDVLLALTWALSEDTESRAGYRTLEGGADNEDVYSFAWLHYAVAALALTRRAPRGAPAMTSRPGWAAAHGARG